MQIGPYLVESKTDKLKVFDFDDTLVKSNSRIKITNNNKVTMLTPAEYAVYDPRAGDEFDFSEFDELISPKEIKAMVKVFKSIVQPIFGTPQTL